MTSAVLPDFEKPPVLEVSAGIQFERLGEMQTRHFGEFWSLIKSEFPSSQDAPPVPEMAETESIQLSFLPPLRRMIAVSADSAYVVQVQDTRFNMNWRRPPGVGEYPRFIAIYRRFQSLWEKFVTFVSQASIGTVKPSRYELTYVNHIEMPEADLMGSIRSHIRMLNPSNFTPTFLPPPASVNLGWQFNLPGDKGQMNASLNHANRANRQIAVLTMSCAGSPMHTSLDDWFSTAHEWIVRGFADLTTDEAHRLWGRTK